MAIAGKISGMFRKYYWWQWTLFVVGGITVISVLGALFLAAGSEPRGHTATGEIPEVSDPLFIKSVSRTLHAQTGKGPKVTPLTNGEEFKNALFGAIDSAQKSVNFSVYIWDEGSFSDQLLEKLLNKQRQGVEVRVLLDSLGSQSMRESDFEPLREAGAKVEFFRSIKFGNITRYTHRNHRRAIIIDGRTGFTGGMAVGDKWLGNAENKDSWRDQMYELKDDLAQVLQGDFADLWSGTTGEFLTGEKFYPEVPPSEDVEYVHIPQNPSADVQILPDFIIVSIKAARQKLYIETPYFVPNNQLLEAIQDRAKSGVDVRLMLPDEHNDMKINRLASQYYYQTLLDSGVKVYEYQDTLNHAKFMVIDGKWSVIGSANLNTRSRRLDEENVFGILDEELGAQHEELFEKDLERSNEITSEEWRKRNQLRRPLEWLSKIFDKQI